MPSGHAEQDVTRACSDVRCFLKRYCLNQSSVVLVWPISILLDEPEELCTLIQIFSNIEVLVSHHFKRRAGIHSQK